MSSWADYYQGELSVAQVLGNLNAHATLFEAVLAESPQTVLEIGVGTGAMGVFLSQWGLRVTGLDNDRTVIPRATSATNDLWRRSSGSGFSRASAG